MESNLGSRPKSGFIILAFKVTDDDNKSLDQNWDEWSGATQLSAMLARKYDLRKVACYKGVNVSPDVLKYIILIEFLMFDGMLLEIKLSGISIILRLFIF